MSTPAPPTTPVVRVRGATFARGGRAVLTGVDLELAPAEVVVVRGRNGAGKSTLLHGLLGLLAPSRGVVELFGGPPRRRRHRAGYVPQRALVSAGLPVTVRELVASGREARLPPWRRPGAADRCAVDCAIDGMGLSGLEGRPFPELSGGQQRRALIARAVATDPELLVLDEPLAGVDADSQRVVTATLAGLVAAGAGLVAVVHGPSPLDALAGRTLHLGAAGPAVR